jgi:hypothetical protein
MPERTPSDNTARQALQIFLCHSSGDKAAVRTLYRRLVEDGFRPWLDEENLLPGQEWEREIPIAVKTSDIVIVCLSRQSVTQIGYVQREIKLALDVADEQPEGTVFLIPVRVEPCDLPKRLSRWQWVDLFESNGYRRLLRSLEERSNSVLNKQVDGREDVFSATSLDSALLRLRKETTLLYGAIVDCLQKRVATGQAPIRNRTLRSIRPDLDHLNRDSLRGNGSAAP